MAPREESRSLLAEALPRRKEEAEEALAATDGGLA